MNVGDLSLDRINTLPPPIVDTILCRLPIKDAVRTSILSKKWRDEFYESAAAAAGTVKLDKLSIMEQTYDFPEEIKRMISDCKFFNAIKQCLLLHKGPLLEFSLVAYGDDISVELDQIISHLSMRNTVKIFWLELGMHDDYELPSSIFSLHQCLQKLLYILFPLVHYLRPSLFMSEFDILGDDKSPISDLIVCLPVIESLITNFSISQVSYSVFLI
ncbi:F-box/FBD/LRR-repeat protein At1g13570-like [Rutidosis leptorrhynchoides]|uniref:F-box/FBD/LRR-repeat protein At1g13570-like n=1 Tax=Rutidosis leptorrhynchoides TaxID=125765 RepID=UPI003A98EFCC